MASGNDVSSDEKKYPVYLMAEGKWVTYQHDCSGFVRAVAAEAGVPVCGDANQIVDHLQKGGGWTSLVMTPIGPVKWRLKAILLSPAGRNQVMAMSRSSCRATTMADPRDIEDLFGMAPQNATRL